MSGLNSDQQTPTTNQSNITLTEFDKAEPPTTPPLHRWVQPVSVYISMKELVDNNKKNW